MATYVWNGKKFVPKTAKKKGRALPKLRRIKWDDKPVIVDGIEQAPPFAPTVVMGDGITTKPSPYPTRAWGPDPHIYFSPRVRRR